MKPFDLAGSKLGGLNLIEASAGTGKTYTLTSLVVRLVVEQDIPITRILVVTFTEAATAELKGRIRERLTEMSDALSSELPTKDPLVQKLRSLKRDEVSLRITNALRVLDEAAIHTIHGFCYRMLLEHAFESGLPLDSELSTDHSALVREAVRTFWSQHVLSMPDIFLEYLEEHSKWPNTFESFYQAISKHPEVEVQVGDASLDDSDVDVLGPYQRAQKIWQTRRKEIVELLIGAIDNLKKNKAYRAEKLPEWFASLDEYFTSEDRVKLSPAAGLTKLNSSSIEDGTKKGCPVPGHDFFDAADELMRSLEQNTIVNERRLAGLFEIAAKEIPELVAAIKRRQALLSFDDLLDLMHRGIKDTSESSLAAMVSRRFGALLIDEFQDTDTRQYDIFRTLFGDGHKPFFVIGDPKQSIYRFRGADIYAYLAARDDAGSRSYTLDTNWRSDPGLVSAIEQIFDREKNPFIEEEIAFGHVNAARTEDTPIVVDGEKRSSFEIAPVPGNGDPESTERHGNPWVRANVPGLVAADVQKLIESGQLGDRAISPGDIAVLVRSNKEVEALAEALESRGIPVVMSSDKSVYLTQDADDLHEILLAIARPERKGLIRTALGSDLFGFTAEEIDGLDRNPSRYETVNLVFRRWNRLWQQKGVLPVLEEVLSNRLGGTGVTALTRLLSFTDGPRRFAALRQLTDILHGAEQRHHMKMHTLCRHFDIKREVGDTVSDDEQLTCLSDEGAVRVMTYHKAKGLEFGVVYCPFVSTGRAGGGHRDYVLAHSQADRQHKILFWGRGALEEYKTEEAREEKAEEMRILYVALTRAKHYCQVAWGPFKTLHDSSMGRLLHPLREDELPKKRKARLAKDPACVLEDELTQLVSSSGGTVGLREIVVDSESCPYRSLDESVRLQLLEPSFERKQSIVWTSFSSLLEGSFENDELFADDLDSRLPDFDVALTDDLGDLPSLFNELEGGMIVGSLLHKIYEDVDFNRQNLSEVVARHLKKFGFNHAIKENIVSNAVFQTMDVQLSPKSTTLKLSALSGTRSRRELEFLLGLGLDSGRGIKPAQLANIAVNFHGSEVKGEYWSKVSHLYSGELAGFLRGFIDLVFEHEGRFYLADYKSNYLGPTIGHYNEQNMRREMEKHHYVLQSLFYSFALHRHLRCKVADYSYDEHFGGAYYLFLRGMHPEAAGRYGVYFQRASEGLFDDLETILEGGA